MLSDTIFDQTQNILTEVAWYYVCQDYDKDQVDAVIDSLATFSAIGIELDLGGDGTLDVSQFVSEDAKLSFIEDARKRLHDRFNECLPEQAARYVQFIESHPPVVD